MYMGMMTGQIQIQMKNKKSNEKKPSTKYSEAGKGSKSRVGISPKEWDERYEKIFGKKSDKDRESI